MPISKELAEVYASAPRDLNYVETLSFSHSKFSKTHYITNSHVAWNFQLEDGTPQKFEMVPFEVRLPTKDSGGIQELQVAIGNIGRELVDELEAASEKPEENIICIYRVYLDVPNSKPQNDPVLSLTISDISLDMFTVTATANRFDVLSRPFPATRYTTEQFPGLKR